MNYEVDLNTLKEANDRVFSNHSISKYYYNLYKQDKDESYLNKHLRLDNCYKYFDVDIYKNARYIDLKHISLCNDKFCKNCQNVLSKQRYIHFKPYLDDIADEHDLYHVVLTVPNCKANELIQTLDNIYLSFAKFIKIFRRKNTRHTYLNLINLGYLGALRSLEITYDEVTGFHPHLHCIFAFKKDLSFEATNINKYSYSNNQLVRKFTDFEITIQKLWYMIYNGVRITEDNYNNLALGYSCIAEVTNYDYKEVFKYTLKESFEYVYNSEWLFNVLRQALYNRRVIQGYGVLYGINDNDEEIKQHRDIAYLRYLDELVCGEQPNYDILTYNNLIEFNNNGFNLITNKNISEVLINEEE